MNKKCDYFAYKNVIDNCPLFFDIPTDSVDEMLHSLNGHMKSYKKNKLIVNIGDEFIFCGLILEGEVEVSYNTNQFEKLNVNHFGPGQLFGEALSLKGIEYSPIQVSALSNCMILLLDLRRLVTSNERCCKSCEYKHQLLLNLMDRMAEQNIFSNLKLRILSQKSLRDRIIIYLIHVHANTQDGATIPFSQTSLAEFLGVNRSALSRELGRMQDEGLLEMDGKWYRLV